MAKLCNTFMWLNLRLGTFFHIKTGYCCSLQKSKPVIGFFIILKTGYWFGLMYLNRYRLLIIWVSNCQLYKWFGQYRTT